VKEVALKILNNGRVYIMHFFSPGHDDRVIMESQCTTHYNEQTNRCSRVTFN